jgi:hypothetical protein
MSKSVRPLLVALFAIAIVYCTADFRQPAGKAEAAAKAASPSAGTSLPPSSWTVPADVQGQNPSQNDWLELGWKTFVALSWPAVSPRGAGIPGQPDSKLPIGASSANHTMIPTTWLTYRSATSTMLPKAVNPGPWNSPQPFPGSCQIDTIHYPVAPGFQPMVLDMTSKLSSPINEVEEASGPPLIDQKGWFIIYDIRLNQSEYTYIHKTGYYDAVNQKNAFGTTPTFVGFPRTGKESIFQPPLPSWAQFGALEVKAAWRVLDPSDMKTRSRYYTQVGYFMQPDRKTCEGPVLFGLVGFHILRLTPSSPSTWFWASFEQVDNVDVPANGGIQPTLATPSTPNGMCTSSYNQIPSTPKQNIPWNNSSTPVNVCRVTNIPADVQLVNQRWRSRLAGTVWANYQMIDTLNPATFGRPGFPIPVSKNQANTNTFANVSLETYVQGQGQSCMQCHAFGFPQGAPQNGTYQVFTFLLGNADSSNPSVPKQGLPREVLDRLHAVVLEKK